jgi:plasmid stability protein
MEVFVSAFVIKNLPNNILRRLKERARKARRSVSWEAVYIMTTALGLRTRPVIELPAPYEGKMPLTDKLIQRWKRAEMA